MELRTKGETMDYKQIADIVYFEKVETEMIYNSVQLEIKPVLDKYDDTHLDGTENISFRFNAFKHLKMLDGFQMKMAHHYSDDWHYGGHCIKVFAIPNHAIKSEATFEEDPFGGHIVLPPEAINPFEVLTSDCCLQAAFECVLFRQLMDNMLSKNRSEIVFQNPCESSEWNVLTALHDWRPLGYKRCGPFNEQKLYIRYITEHTNMFGGQILLQECSFFFDELSVKQTKDIYLEDRAQDTFCKRLRFDTYPNSIINWLDRIPFIYHESMMLLSDYSTGICV